MPFTSGVLRVEPHFLEVGCMYHPSISKINPIFNSLSNYKILALSKLKAFAVDKSNVAKMVISVFDRVENIVGKRKKCWLTAFSPFPTMLSKAVCCRDVKTKYYLGKG